jgi:hypothetical protein
MRITLLILAFTSFISLQAQTVLPVSGVGYMQPHSFGYNHLLNDSNAMQKKWSVSMYGGMGIGYSFFNHGSAAFLPVTAGLQVNRRLNNNLYAFAGVQAAPVFFNYNSPFINGNPHNSYMTTPGFNANNLGIYTGVQAGLMWVNDDKTFSVSGSIGVGRSNYPKYVVPVTNAQKQPAFKGARQ